LNRNRAAGRWFKNDNDLSPIRSHPRFRRLIELAG
jgi:hypothetical protein